MCNVKVSPYLWLLIHLSPCFTLFYFFIFHHLLLPCPLCPFLLFFSSLIFSSSITTSFLFPLSRDWLTVCCVYFGLQGDVGLPGPSGTPGDGSLRSEQTLTIYKGDQVTQQVKGRSWGCSASTTHTHTNTHSQPYHTWMWWGLITKMTSLNPHSRQCNVRN